MSGRHRKDGPAVDEALPTEVPVGQPWGLEATPLPLANLTPVRGCAHPGCGRCAGARPGCGARRPAPAPAPAPAQVPVARPLPSVPFAAPVGTGSAAEAAPVLPVGSSARRAAREQQRRRSRRSKGLVVGLVAVLAVVAAVGGYKVWRGGIRPAGGCRVHRAPPVHAPAAGRRRPAPDRRRRPARPRHPWPGHQLRGPRAQLARRRRLRHRGRHVRLALGRAGCGRPAGGHRAVRPRRGRRRRDLGARRGRAGRAGRQRRRCRRERRP